MASPGPIRATASGVSLDLRVIPRSPRTGLNGIRDGRLLLRVTAPPVDQAANEAVVEAIADLFDQPRRSVRVVSGLTSRNKVVEVTGVSVADATKRVG